MLNNLSIKHFKLSIQHVFYSLTLFLKIHINKLEFKILKKKKKTFSLLKAIWLLFIFWELNVVQSPYVVGLNKRNDFCEN